MTITRQHMVGRVRMEAPFFDELLIADQNENGRLTRDYECHALWHYYMLACKNYRDMQANFVEESELSRRFTPSDARVLFGAIANIHGVEPEKMMRFWPVVERQRSALGGDEILPDPYKFKFWSN